MKGNRVGTRRLSQSLGCECSERGAVSYQLEEGFVGRFKRNLLVLICFVMSLGWSTTSVFAHHDTPRVEFLPDELIVMAKDPLILPSTLDCLKSANARILRTITAGGDQIFLVKTEPGAADATLARLKREVYHVWVQKNYKILTQAAPNDPYFPQQWQLGGLGVNAVNSWKYGKGNRATIAVLDTGCTWNLPELTGRSYRNYNSFDNKWDTPTVGSHGTMVATTMVANTNNRFNGAGVAPGAMIQPVQVCNSSGLITEFSVLTGMVYAANRGVRIINLSLNVPQPDTLSNVDSHPIFHHLARWYHETKNGMLFVASGNQPGFDESPRSPYVMVVTGYGELHIMDSRYTTGFPVWFGGPGVNVLCTDSNNRVVRTSGTSVATACVSGAAALVLSANPSLSNRQIEAILKYHAFPFFSGALPNSSVGWGVPDAERSVSHALNLHQ